MGTYNYCGHKKNIILHGILDVMTYDKWGNVKGVAYEKHARSIKDYKANQEAQDAYRKIEEQMNSN